MSTSPRENKEAVFKEAFDNFKAPDGTLNLKYLGNVLRYLNYDPTEKEIQNYIQLLDPQQTGFATWENFFTVSKKLRQPFSKKELEQAFAYLDKNKDQKISSEEFKTVMTTQGDKLTPEETANIFQEIDVDGNGYIDINEFITKLMTK